MIKESSSKLKNVLHLLLADPILTFGQLQSIGYTWNRLLDRSFALDNDRDYTLSTVWRAGGIWCDVCPKAASLKAKTDWHRVFAHNNNHCVQCTRTLTQHRWRTVLGSARWQSFIKVKITHRTTSTTGLHWSKRAFEYLHLDPIGGQNSPPPATSSTDFPLDHSFLLVVNGYCSYKRAFPVHSKKDASSLAEALLEQLKNQTDRHPKEHCKTPCKFQIGQPTQLPKLHHVRCFTANYWISVTVILSAAAHPNR